MRIAASIVGHCDPKLKRKVVACNERSSAIGKMLREPVVEMRRENTASVVHGLGLISLFLGD